MKKETLHFIDTWLNINYRVNDLPGISIGITENGKEVFAKGYGYANIVKKQPNTEKTLFRIASISKVFTAISILQLEQKGKLKISDKISKHLPWFASELEPKLQQITIKELLTHEAKITRDGEGQVWDTDKFLDEQGLYSQLLYPIHYPKSKHKFKYSNYGYSLLGLIITKTSGQTFEQYLKNNILKPLGLQNTTSIMSKATERKLATGYSSKEFPDFKRKVFGNPSTNAMASATGLSSCINDLNKFGIAIAKKSPKLLNKQFWAKAYSKQWNYQKEIRNLIMFGKPSGKHILWGHGGGFQGHTTMLALDLKNDLGINIMINQILSKSFGYAKAVHKIINDWPKLSTKDKAFKLHPKKPLEYEGLYTGRWGSITVISIGKNLAICYSETMEPTANLCFLEYKGNDTFISHESDPYGDDREPVRFLRGSTGKIVECETGGSSRKKVEL